MKTKLALATLLFAACGDANTADDLGNLALDLSSVAHPDLTSGPQPDLGQAPSHRVIVFVWDGLRPDSINATDTPNLLALKQGGVEFTDNHSTYPTFTMMNAAAFATGSFPGTTGFYGNSLWQEGPTGNSSAGTPADFVDPVFTEDYAILQDLDTFYSNQLLLVGTLFQAAQTAGLKTAAIGKSGPAFLQDYKKGGMILDEKTVFPLSLAKEIQQSNVLPATTPFAYATGMLTLGSGNGNPTALAAKVTLGDKTTSDATDTSGSPVASANFYMMDAYIRHILPKNPDLTLIWFRAPDSPEHNYGPGAPNAHAAVRHQDILLGQLETALHEQGLDGVTNLIIVSDHGHSSVSGPLGTFPLHKISSGNVDTTDGGVSATGWSVSGDVRLADLLAQNGFANVYDGQPCLFVPVMSGIKGDGTSTPVYPTLTDVAGTACNKGASFKYTTGAFLVPNPLPAGVHNIVIATNGGSDYLYVPDHDAATVANVVAFLQSREEIGAIFLNSRYTANGTLPLAAARLENAARAPDIMFSYNYDETAVVAGMPGIEFESMSASSNRGMHGSFSPVDVHNTLLAKGPDFKTALADTLPSGNVDVAPTVAKIFGLSLPNADGRSLDEALETNGAAIADYTATPSVVNPTAPATGLVFKKPTSPSGADVDTGSTYNIDLHLKTLTKGAKTWKYFDYAKAVRN